MIDPIICLLAAAVVFGLSGWILGLFMFHIANKEMRKHLLAEQRCTDLWGQLIAERKARIEQMREEVFAEPFAQQSPEPVKQPNPKPL